MADAPPAPRPQLSLPPPEDFVRDPRAICSWVAAHPEDALAVDVDATTFARPANAGGGLMTLRRLLESHDKTLPHFLTYAPLPDGANALFVAVTAWDTDTLDTLLAAPEPRRYDLEWVFDGRVGTVLAHAARRGATWALCRLLDAGADPEYTSPHGESLLHAAAVGGAPECVRALACALSARSANAVAVTTSRITQTPLVAAVTCLHPPALVEALLAAGADPNLGCDGCPPAGRVLLMLVGGLPPTDALAAKRLLRVLVSNNRTDLDRPWIVLGGSLRAYAAAHNIHMQ